MSETDTESRFDDPIKVGFVSRVSAERALATLAGNGAIIECSETDWPAVVTEREHAKKTAYITTEVTDEDLRRAERGDDW